MAVVAIPSFGSGGLNESFCDIFGRCDSFTFVTIENNEILEVIAIENPARKELGGAGVKVARFLVQNKAEDVIIGIIGSNTSQFLSTLKIKMLKAPDRQLKVKEALDLYMEGNLSTITSSDIANKAGAKRETE